MAMIPDTIRKAIKTGKKTRYAISKETGISESQLSQFMKGTKGLSYESLELVADCLGLEIVIRPKHKKKAGKK